MKEEVETQHLEKRFGVIAIESGYVTPKEFVDALKIQVMEDIEKGRHRLIGRILLERGYISSGQVREVLRQMGLPVRFCPEKGGIDTGTHTAGKPKERARPLKALMQ